MIGFNGGAILGLATKIEKLIEKEVPKEQRNHVKIFMDDNEITFSFTRKGYKSQICDIKDWSN